MLGETELSTATRAIVLVLAGASMAFAAGALIAPFTFRTPRFVTALGAQAQPVAVPEVVGMSRQDAQRTIEAAGLVAAGQWSEYGPLETMGLVIMQDPAPGTQVPRGSPMNFFWNIGPLFRTYHPEQLVGLPASEAEEKIAEWQLYTSGRSRMPHPVVPEGHVIAVCPVQADSLPVSTTVRLLVSTGWEGVPVFVGMREDHAESVAVEHHLVLLVTDAPASSPELDGTVISQEPRPGVPFLYGDSVGVTVARSGPPAVQGGPPEEGGQSEEGWGQW